MDTASFTAQTWLIPCSHVFDVPATERQIASLASALQRELPAQLENLLRETNGAGLFRLRYQSPELGDYGLARYNILNNRDLEKFNSETLDTFLSYAEFDREYNGYDLDNFKLNYLAFCDVGDGNFLAISLQNGSEGKIFFLDHDYGFYPYGTQHTANAYTHVANSLEEWLNLLIISNGQTGTGDKYIPL